MRCSIHTVGYVTQRDGGGGGGGSEVSAVVGLNIHRDVLLPSVTHVHFTEWETKYQSEGIKNQRQRDREEQLQTTLWLLDAPYGGERVRC